MSDVQIIDVEDYQNDEAARLAADTVIERHYGVTVDVLDITRVIIGERNVWVWRLLRNENGQHYRDEATGNVAYEVDRIDKEEVCGDEAR